MNTVDGKALAARETFLAECVTTGVESGIWYWAEVEEYRWYFPDLAGGSARPAPHGGGNAWAEITEREAEADGSPDPRHSITPKTIAKAYKLLRSDRPIPYVSARWRERMLTARRLNDALDIDSGDADSLIQIGLFGRPVYG